MRNSALAVLLVGLVLGGCATTGPGVPVEVEIPVPAQCPVPVMPERPHLDIGDLPAGNVPEDEVIRAYAVSLAKCAAYSKELENLLGRYAKQPAGKAVR